MIQQRGTFLGVKAQAQKCENNQEGDERLRVKEEKSERGRGKERTWKTSGQPLSCKGSWLLSPRERRCLSSDMSKL